jgi:molybdopterin molybdotransferase
MPAGADAVVPCEQAVAGSAAVVVEVAPAPGAWIRRAGDDFAAGAIVVTAGTRLGPAELGVLAAVGGAEVSCTRRPRVAVMTTGDELVAPGGQMYPGAVRDASAHSIPALARCAGAEVVTCAHVGDDREAIAATLHDILGVDAVVVCGGASVGEHDHVRSAAATEGVRELFWGVALKPGKPTWFGVRGDTLVFGLPGNPVSSMVTFILLCAPALRALSGSQSRPLRAVATLTADYAKEPGRAHAVRCRAHVGEDGWEVEPTGPQGSHILTSMLGASALAIIPSASGSVSAGTRVEIELLASIWPEQLAAPAGGDAA